MQMTVFDVVRGRLADAYDLDSTMAAGWEAFEFILLVANKYSGLKSGMFATWMWAMGPAADGSGLLEPALSRGGAGFAAGPGDLDEASEDDAVRALASLASELRGKLRAAALGTRIDRVHDIKACRQAAEAASELHGLFALGE